MTTRAAAARRERAARRGRTLAVTAVLACVALDVWAVAGGASGTSAAPPEPASAVVASHDPGTGVFESLQAGARVGAAGGTAAGASGGPANTPATAPTAPTTAAPKPSDAPTVVQRGNGRFTVVAVPASAVKEGPKTGRTVRYTVEIEGDLRIDATGYAATVARVLTDARGWQAADGVRFVDVTPKQVKDGARVDLRVSLASPDTTDRLCAPLQTRGEVSCFNAGRAVLNARRWQLGIKDYGGDLAAYRAYQVSHEVGHGLGHGHASCPGQGKPAPVMMQQSYGLKGCAPQPWPDPNAR
jgi:hypothetical protein